MAKLGWQAEQSLRGKKIPGILEEDTQFAGGN